MKKSHLLWKILVVVMIVSAMMATFIACGEKHDCNVDGHGGDENDDGRCDICGEILPNHTHVDENRDDVCDKCGEKGAKGVHCKWGYHVDADNNHRCDDCTVIYGAEGDWNAFISELDKVVDSMGSMGDLSTMGGSLTAGIDFAQGKTKHNIDIALDFGLELREFQDNEISFGSENAFGFTIKDTVNDADEAKTIAGLWYVDNGAAKDNYILGVFGDKVFKFNAPSLAETFNTYPISVNVDMADKVGSVQDIDASSVVDIIAGILPLTVSQSGNSTTYSLPLTDYLFNKVGMTDEAFGLGALLSTGLASLGGITDVFDAIGIDSTSLLDTLDELIPGLSLDITFDKDANGNTTGAAIGLSIAGEKMSVKLFQDENGDNDGLIYDIFKTEADAGNGTIIINNGFEDIEIDVSLGYEFGSNSEQADYPYSAKAKAAYDTADKTYGATAKKIGLINAAIEGEVTLGLGNVAATGYPVKIAIDLNPSVLTKDGLLTDAYVINDKGQGIKDKDGNPKMVKAINLKADSKVTAYEVVLSAIDNLYIKLGDLEVSLRSKTVNDDGTVNFAVDLAGLSWIRNLLENSFGVNLGSASQIFDALSDGENKEIGSSSPVKGIVIQLLSGLVTKGFQYGEPAEFVTESTSSEGGDSEGGNNEGGNNEGSASSTVNIAKIFSEIVRYIEMFKFDRTDENTLKLTVNEDNMNKAGVSFEATASVTKDTDGNIDSFTLALGESGLVIKGSDGVNTTIKLLEPLKVGGEGNLFSAKANVVSGTKLNLTIGLDLKGIGYGVVPKVGEKQITNDNFGELFSDPALSISVN